jgi:L-cysteine desulfidase
MGGLAFGCGGGCGTCGVMTGASCMIALFAGKGSDEETASEQFMLMLSELTDWFSETYGSRHGGITCDAIVGDEGPRSAMSRCGQMVADTYKKAIEILMANDFEI